MEGWQGPCWWTASPSPGEEGEALTRNQRLPELGDLTSWGQVPPLLRSSPLITKLKRQVDRFSSSLLALMGSLAVSQALHFRETRDLNSSPGGLLLVNVDNVLH